MRGKIPSSYEDIIIIVVSFACPLEMPHRTWISHVHKLWMDRSPLEIIFLMFRFVVTMFSVG